MFLEYSSCNLYECLHEMQQLCASENHEKIEIYVFIWVSLEYFLTLYLVRSLLTFLMHRLIALNVYCQSVDLS